MRGAYGIGFKKFPDNRKQGIMIGHVSELAKKQYYREYPQCAGVLKVGESFVFQFSATVSQRRLGPHAYFLRRSCRDHRLSRDPEKHRAEFRCKEYSTSPSSKTHEIFRENAPYIKPSLLCYTPVK